MLQTTFLVQAFFARRVTKGRKLHQRYPTENTSPYGQVRSGLRTGGRGGRKNNSHGVMSGGKPVLVSVMYSPKAGIRWGSDHKAASCPREVTSFSRRSRTLARAGQERMAWWEVSGSVPQRGQVGFGSSSNQEGCATR